MIRIEIKSKSLSFYKITQLNRLSMVYQWPVRYWYLLIWCLKREVAFEQQPYHKFLRGGGGISPLFLLNYFLFNLFLFLQKKSSAQSLVDQLLRQIATALFVNK